MEIICNQNELNNAIQLVSKAVSSRPTHPILANILLTADLGTNKISLTGFDLNLGIQTSFDGTVKNSGAITIPSKLLSEKFKFIQQIGLLILYFSTNEVNF